MTLAASLVDPVGTLTSSLSDLGDAIATVAPVALGIGVGFFALRFIWRQAKTLVNG
jgi:hypothetical protein